MDNERFDEIRLFLAENKSATVKQLAAKLFVSAATIRRDLTEMEHLGIVQRTHGGAILHQNTDDESAFIARVEKNQAEKRRIAAAAAELLHGGMTLFLDSSSTVSCLVPFLSRFPGLTVVTNGIRTALELSKLENVSVHMAGGELKSFGNGTLGCRTVSFINELYFDFALLSCSGISADGYFTDGNPEHCAVKKAAAKNSAKIAILADSEKFGIPFMNKTLAFNEADFLITDAKPSPEFTDLLGASDCRLIVNEK